MSRPTPWPPAAVRAWIARHGGNVTTLARRLDVPRTLLQKWAQEGGSAARDLPRYIQAHARTLDGLQAWLARWQGRMPPEAAAELRAVLRGEAPREN